MEERQFVFSAVQSQSDMRQIHLISALHYSALISKTHLNINGMALSRGIISVDSK